MTNMLISFVARQIAQKPPPTAPPRRQIPAQTLARTGPRNRVKTPQILFIPTTNFTSRKRD